MALTSLDISYSCSYFGGDDQTPDEVIAQFVKIEKLCHAENLAKLDHQLDISYGAQKFDLWGAATNGKKMLVFVHGGYWTEGDKTLCTSVASAIVKSGINVACVGYDLAPSISLPQIVDQISKAITHISNSYQNTKICLSGHSAGAHLILKAIERCGPITNVNKIILICGLYNVTGLVDTYIGRSISLSKEIAIEMDIDVKKLAEKITHTKLLILTAEHDAPKIQEQNIQLKQLLQTHLIDAQLKVINGTNHFTIIEELRKLESPQTQTILDFLKEN